jgi:hypothetical protein
MRGERDRSDIDAEAFSGSFDAAPSRPEEVDEIEVTNERITEDGSADVVSLHRDTSAERDDDGTHGEMRTWSMALTSAAWPWK